MNTLSIYKDSNMTKQQLESYKKQMEQVRAEKARTMEEIALKQKRMALESSERHVQFIGEIEAIQIYADWLKKYKAKNPDFNENKNNFKINEDGVGCICFSDPQAEEDFVRHLAANEPQGQISDKGIIIAKFKDGMLIDPRTNQEFKEGEYAALVHKLDSGIAYDDIPAPRSTTPTPFSMTPY